MGLITNILSGVSAAPLSPSHVLTISTVTGERGRGDIIDLYEECAPDQWTNSGF